MAAATNKSIRVRLYFDYPPPAAIDWRMCWLLVDLNKCRVVADLESIIKEKFEFSRSNILNLFIEDCYLPHTEHIYVVRDNDSIRVKVDSLTHVNGHRSHPDASGDNSRKRLRQSEDDEPAENGVSVEWEKIKRKKKSDESIEKETKRTLGDEQDKNSQRKHKKQKKKKDKAAVTPKPTTSTKKDSTNRGQAIKSTKPIHGKANVAKHDRNRKDDEAPKETPAAKRVPKTPSSTPAPSKAPPNAKLPTTKPCPSSSSSETDSSSDEGPGKASSKSLPKYTPLKTPAAKLVPKTPSSIPAPSKAPPNAKQPATKPHPHPSSSSSETDSSSDEGPGKASSKSPLKKTPLAKPITSTTPCPKTSPASRPQRSPSAPPPANCSQKRAAGRALLQVDKVVEQPETSDSDSEEEIKLVIRQPVQGLAPARSQPLWQARGRGMAWRSGGRGERGRGEGRGRGRGQSGIQLNYNGGQQAEQTSYQNDLLTNNSVVLQNGVETAPVRDYSSMPLLAAPPQVGQKIAFKLLELTENYTPEVSEYKEGKIMSFDPTTKQIELELLRASQAPVEPGKFDLVYQNADGSERVEYAVTRGSWVTERWDSLLEPRLVI